MSPSGSKTTNTKFPGVNLRVTINFIKYGLASCCQKLILKKKQYFRIWLWFHGMLIAVNDHLYFFSPYHVLQVTFWSWTEGYKWTLTYLRRHPHYSSLPFYCGFQISLLSLSIIFLSHTFNGWVLSYTEGYTKHSTKGPLNIWVLCMAFTCRLTGQLVKSGRITH